MPSPCVHRSAVGKELQEAKRAIRDTQRKLAEQSAVRAGSFPSPPVAGTRGAVSITWWDVLLAWGGRNFVH